MELGRWIQKIRKLWTCNRMHYPTVVLNICIYLRAKVAGCDRSRLKTKKSPCKTSAIGQMKNLEVTEDWMLKLVKNLRFITTKT